MKPYELTNFKSSSDVNSKLSNFIKHLKFPFQYYSLYNFVD